MVVQHNLTAMNSNRMLGVTTSQQAKSTEKLSSGYKINRAADDAAGLSISEKMRKQIRGLTQASANAQDGISAVQTAEGALTEVHDMLQRMNELAVKSANGTNSESDRTAIQSEIDQLTTEIDRVAETTKFNETYLLKGDKDAPKQYSFTYGNVKTEATATATFSSDAATGLGVKSMTFEAPADRATADLQNELANALKASGLSITAESKWDVDGATAKGSISLSLNGAAAEKFNVVSDANDPQKFEIQDKSGNKLATIELNDYDLTAAKEGDDFKNTVAINANSVTAAEKGQVSYYDRDGNEISENALNKYFTGSVNGQNYDANVKSGMTVYDAVGNERTLYADEVNAKRDVMGTLTVGLHVGADATSNNQITMNIESMSAKGLGVNGLRVDGTSDANALKAVETIKEAISKVSSQRSDLGAVQNRLEHTINNLDNVVENTTSAESAIRDTDMASEMVKYSNNNILSQAGTSMLAQANQSNQSVLSLLG